MALNPQSMGDGAGLDLDQAAEGIASLPNDILGLDEDDESQPAAVEGDDADQEDAEEASDGDDAESEDGADDTDADDEDEQTSEGDADAIDESTLLELDGPDGKPVQVTLSELVAAYTAKPANEQRMSREMQESKRQIDAAVEQANAARQRYEARLSEIDALIPEPTAPDRAMLDQNSDKYDPEAYMRARVEFEDAVKARETALSERTKAQEEAAQRQQELDRQLIAQERQRLQEFWPEFTDPVAGKDIRTKFAQDVERHYGFGVAELSKVYDSRLFKVLKAAVEHANASAPAQKESRIKRLKAKPRVLRPGQSTTSKDRRGKRVSQAQARLTKTGDHRDAAALLEQAFGDDL